MFVTFALKPVRTIEQMKMAVVSRLANFRFHYRVQRPIQGNAGTHPAQRPQPNCVSRFPSDLSHQFIAQRGTDAGLQVLKVRKEAALLVRELPVDALLASGKTRMLSI